MARGTGLSAGGPMALSQAFYFTIGAAALGFVAWMTLLTR
jgi:hypothetical protein